VVDDNVMWNAVGKLSWQVARGSQLSFFRMTIKRTWRLRRASVEPRVDFYNLLNASTVLGRLTQLGPSYGRVANIQRGRLIKIGFNVDF
jgi:hypothetical protein